MKKQKSKHSAKTISNALTSHYENQALYMVPNIYIFHHEYKETDFLVVKSGKGYCYDIEIKISRADFFADFKKKNKHSILKEGYYTKPYWSSEIVNGVRKAIGAGKAIPVSSRPHRFYYAVPEGMVNKEEVPPYAGLLYVTEEGTVKKIKEAKLLHKEKLNLEEKLCRKFYFYWKDALEKIDMLKKSQKLGG